MANETPRYLGIGRVEINEAFLNQVASSMQRFAIEASGGSEPASTRASLTPDKITPAMRENARAFIKEHFLIGDDDV